MLSKFEIEELLRAPGDYGRTPMHDDSGVTYLICRFILNLMIKHKRPFRRGLAEIILKVAGFEEPCSYQEILKKAMAPLAEEYKDSKYARAFGNEFSLVFLSMAFDDNDSRIVTAAKEAIIESLRLQTGQNPLPPPGSSSFVKRLKEISAVFELDVEEQEICAFCFVKQVYQDFFMLSSYLFETSSSEHVAAPIGQERDMVFADLFSFSKERFKALIDKNSKLIKLGLMKNDFELSFECFDFLSSNGYDLFKDRFFAANGTDEKPFSRPMFSEIQLETIKAIVLNRAPGQNINLLVSGNAGIDKIEAVNQLCRNLGLNLVKVKKGKPEWDITYRNSFRISALWAAQQHAGANPDTALLIDDADHMLSCNEIDLDTSYLGPVGSPLRNCAMREAMTHGGAIHFWIIESYSVNYIDPYARHFFDYTLILESDDCLDRLNFMRETVEKYGIADLITLEDLRTLASKFQVDNGIIDSALKNSANLSRHGWSKRRIVNHITHLLEGNTRLVDAEFCPGSEPAEPDKIVAPEHLNIEPKADLTLLLEVIKRARHQLKTNGNKIAILLSGIPGSGKTRFAKYIADSLNRTLLLKTAGSILDKWLGETEGNIKKAFEEAEKRGAVLFFDEIDSLMATREKATQHWQISQVNELLASLDGYRGFFIAATNNAGVLDKASLRRFDFHFHMGSLNSEGNTRFYKTLIAPFALGKMTKEEAYQLAEMEELAPSDFGSLRQRLELLPDVKKNHSELLRGLIERRNMRLNRKPAEIADGDDAKYLLTDRKKGE